MDCNQAFLQAIRRTEKPVGGRLSDFLDTGGRAATQTSAVDGETGRVTIIEGRKGYWAYVLPQNNGRVVVLEPMEGQGGELLDDLTAINNECLQLSRDLTKKQKELEMAYQAQEKLVAELNEALAKVKTLKGLLPLCSRCKKIRDDRGYWGSLETYISTHTDADFTHGLCPDCIREQFPEEAEEIIGEIDAETKKQ
jgi:DNA repair exonuclease SbcCD ATPase subunit